MPAAEPPPKHRRSNAPFVLRFLRHPSGRIGFVLLLFEVACAAFAPWWAPYDPIVQHPGFEMLTPFRNWAFPLGTDELGRDLMSRIMWSARESFIVGSIAVTVGVLLGGLAGLLGGYFGGWVDSVFMRICDVLITFPSLLLALALTTALGPSSTNVAVALAIVVIPSTARLLRGQVLVEREREYVVAARSLGADAARVMFTHILPNSISPLLVTVFIALSMSVVADAGLSFIGLGERPPEPSWGNILRASRAYLRDSWWYMFTPAVALGILVYSLNCISDALRDVLDPRTARD